MNVIPFDRAAYDGFIFDCDGTLADSMPVHYRAWRQTLENKLGRVPEEISWPFFQNFGGVPANVIVEQWNREFGYGLPVEETVREKAEAFLRLLDEVRPMPEVLAVVKELAGRPGAKVAVASSGLTRVIEKIVRHFGLAIGVDGEIKAVVCADQVARGKPAPDLFLRAAELLGVPPERCLVFEDADSGFRAAHAAGMDCLDVRPYLGAGETTSFPGPSS